MSIHLIKLCVGIEDIDNLIRVHKSRIDRVGKTGKPNIVHHITRNMPRRANELLNGGSLYWVIRGKISVRQPIIGIEKIQREDGRTACAIILETQYIRTVPRQARVFQGWRYLSGEDAPQDLRADELELREELPTEMSAELRELGLL